MKYNPLNAYAAGIVVGAILYYVFADSGSNPFVLFGAIALANLFAWVRPIR